MSRAYDKLHKIRGTTPYPPMYQEKGLAPLINLGNNLNPNIFFQQENQSKINTL